MKLSITLSLFLVAAVAAAAQVIVTGRLDARTTPLTLRVNEGLTSEQVLWLDGVRAEEAELLHNVFVTVKGDIDRDLPLTILRAQTIKQASYSELKTRAP